eukprot:532944-Lingulodinium_polyedra.AAC.1
MGAIHQGLKDLLAKGSDAVAGQGTDGVVTARPSSTSDCGSKAPKEVDAFPPLPPPSRAPSCVGEPEKSAGPAPATAPRSPRSTAGGSATGSALTKGWGL